MTTLNKKIISAILEGRQSELEKNFQELAAIKSVHLLENLKASIGQGLLISEELVSELSKETLKSYVKKASNDLGHKAFNSGQDSEKSHHYKKKSEVDKRGDSFYKKISKMHQNNADKDRKHAENRIKGINRAADKLTKEEPLNELSKETLKSYKEKSKESIRNDDTTRKSDGAIKRGDYKTHSNIHNKMVNRWNGINQASKKLEKK